MAPTFLLFTSARMSWVHLIEQWKESTTEWWSKDTQRSEAASCDLVLWKWSSGLAGHSTLGVSHQVDFPGRLCTTWLFDIHVPCCSSEVLCGIGMGEVFKEEQVSQYGSGSWAKAQENYLSFLSTTSAAEAFFSEILFFKGQLYYD